MLYYLVAKKKVIEQFAILSFPLLQVTFSICSAIGQIIFLNYFELQKWNGIVTVGMILLSPNCVLSPLYKRKHEYTYSL